MEEYRVTICVRAPNQQVVDDWLSYLHFITDEIPEFFWTIDEVEKGSAFDG
jgi:hypothetical protein